MTGNARRPPRPVPGPPGQPGAPGTAAPGGPPAALDQLFDGDSLYALRAAVAAHGSQAGLSDGRIRDLVLVVHELAANAVRHGAGHGRVRLWTTRDAVRCEVSDHAPGGPAGPAGPDMDGAGQEGPAATAAAAMAATATAEAAEAGASRAAARGRGGARPRAGVV